MQTEHLWISMIDWKMMIYVCNTELYKMFQIIFKKWLLITLSSIWLFKCVERLLQYIYQELNCLLNWNVKQILQLLLGINFLFTDLVLNQVIKETRMTKNSSVSF